ncbi:MAG TPA: hypothetical protein VFW78_03065 [Bacteroidia bacterium]|nr:hypothetical protein [Bacteroidia bacterium]
MLKVIYKERNLVRTVTTFLVVVLFGTTLLAQDISFKAKVDTNEIKIGQQFRLELEAQYPKGYEVTFPALPDTFQGFEMIRQLPADSITRTADTFRQVRKYILTSFDSGYHVIAPLTAQFFVKGDTTIHNLETEAMLVSVSTVQVDTTKAIKDIKDLAQYPYTWQDALPWIIGIILALLLGWLVYLLVKHHKKKTVLQQDLSPPVPPHIKALEQLELIEKEKLWQQGKVKIYYTRVTDVMRVYLSETRFINALEMTTNELLRVNSISLLSIDQHNSLKQMLEMADLVKFAKVDPLPSDNEQTMLLAVKFITTDQTEMNSVKTEELS